MYRQQRLHTRIPKKLNGVVEHVVPGAGLKTVRHIVTTRDVSRGGCCSIMVPMELELRSRVTITLDIPTSESGLPSAIKFKSPAVVRWRKPAAQDQFQVGLEFVDIPKSLIDGWNDLIHRWGAGEF
jgi:hypothetical protein